MAKLDREFAIAFATQVAEGTYNATLDAIAGTLTVADGLLLGQSGEGEADSGIEVTFERTEEERAPLAGGLTQPPGVFLRRNVSELTFTVPFCGNREDTTAVATVDADFEPLPGLDALLQGVGFTSQAATSGVGWEHFLDVPQKISALFYANGVRYELLDCIVESFELEEPPGSFSRATFTVRPGSVKDASEAAVPATLTFGVQATVKAPIVENADNAWGNTRGWQENTLSIENDVEEVEDSNAPGGLIPETVKRKITVTSRLYGDTAAEMFEWTQLGADEAGDLAARSWHVGEVALPEEPALAYFINAPMPVAQNFKPIAIGGKAGVEVEVTLHHTTSGQELSIHWR